MKSKNIHHELLWEYPFGTQVLLSDVACEMLGYNKNSEDPALFTYVYTNSEIGDLIIDSYGVQVWLSGDLGDIEITVFSNPIEEDIDRYVNGLSYYVLGLQEEPFIHREHISDINEIIGNMVRLRKTLREENE